MIVKGPPSQCPKLKKSLGHLLLTKMGQNECLTYQIDPYTDTKLTHGELRSRSIRVALQLRKLGLEKNDTITICTANHKNTVLPFLASLYLGATVNPLERSFNANDLARIINLVKPKMVFCDEIVVPKFKKMLEDLNMTSVPIYVSDIGFEENFLKEPENPQMETDFEAVDVDVNSAHAMIICSSGTTGFMKGVVHTHKTLYHAVCDTEYVAKPTDVMFANTTMAWNSAPWLMIYAIMFGSVRVVANFDCTMLEIMQSIKKYKVTHLNATPAKLNKILKHPEFPEYKEAIQNLRVAWSRGAANTPTQMNYYRSQLPRTHIINAIGTTEMCMLVACFDSDKEYDLNLQKVFSNGKLCPGVEAKIIDPVDQKELGYNEKGELWIKSESMTPGYFKNPEANASTFTSDGWYRTGDMAYFDTDDCLFVVGRYKEIVRYESSWVIPSELEFIINQHPAVQMSCVMGIPDEMSGELPMAFVIKKPGVEVTAEDIIKHVQVNGSSHQQLRGGVRFVDSFELTASGKIRRFALQKLLDS